MEDEFPDKTLIERLFETGQTIDDLIMSHGNFGKPADMDFSLLHDFASEPRASWEHEITLAQQLIDTPEMANYPHLRNYVQAIALTCPHGDIARHAARIWLECILEINEATDMSKHLSFAYSCLPEGSPLQAQVLEHYKSGEATANILAEDPERDSSLSL